VSPSTIAAADSERLLVFEVDSAAYALPIAEVHEVAEAQRIRCVPTISRDLVGIMNWHGDALPVVLAPLLLDSARPQDDEPLDADEESAEGAPTSVASQHVLVVSGRDNEAAQLGIPIDRVIGLVDGLQHRRGGARLVVERRSVDGRVVSVLDPRRLVARASEVIGHTA
jgi:chemotaxis signal transduction protein